MSENTPGTPQTPPSSFSPQSPPFPPHVRPVTGRYTPPPQQVHYQQPPVRSSGCGQVAVFGIVTLCVLGVIGVGVLVGSIYLFTVASDAFDEISGERDEKTVSEKVIGGNRSAQDKIAVISIDGVIYNNEDGFVAKQIRKVMSDTRVKAVVLRVDSPGGTMSGSDYYLHLLKKMKSERDIPILVSMGGTAASGGYYVSMVGDEIYAEPSTLTGSIGVIFSLFDASEFFQKIGVESNPITSGEHKTMGSFMKPMTEEERSLFQHLIDDSFDRFKMIIREGRTKFADNPEMLDKLATGEMFTANDAVKNGLIDKIGFLDDVIDRAGTLANLNKRDYKVIQYKPKLSLLALLEGQMEGHSSDNLLSGKTLSNVTTPRIYLLCPYVIPVKGMD